MKFTEFRDKLLVEFARYESERGPDYHDLKKIADGALLIYKEGWVSKAAYYFRDQGLIKDAFTMGGGADDNLDAELTGEGLERAEELLEELDESDPIATGTVIPASDRVVFIDHNSADFREMKQAIEEVKNAVLGNNKYGASEPEDREQRVAELDAGLTLLTSVKVRVTAIVAVLGSALTYFATKFADAAIGGLATSAWNIIKAFFGL